MPITSLRVADFRNLASVEIAPTHHGLNIICGNNGSGKTSLLEAIYYLGLGKSFRSSTSGRIIRHSTNKFSLFAQLVSDQRQLPIGIERDLNGAVRMRLAEKEVASITELAAFLPIRVINSQSHSLFESGPVFRRKYLDWGLFYQSDHFLICWRHFERVLKQRNAALRDKRTRKELNSWTEELVKSGLELDGLRREYVKQLTPVVIDVATELLAQSNLPISSLNICYQPGWDEETDYATQLDESYYDELRLGHTQFGPHRADLDIEINAVSVRHFLSRGQQKLLICAMILAQGMLLATHANKSLIYLVDDLPSELDLQSRKKLISLLSKQQTQVFITAIESDTICDFVNTALPLKVFHVERGSVVNQHPSIPGGASCGA